MKVRTILALGTVLTLCVASDALAQRGGGRGGMFGGVSRLGLLRIEKVQEEIKLTDEQQQKLEAARDELRQGRGGFGGQNFQDLSPEERREAFAKIRAERAAAEKKALASTLEEGQVKRLNEIYIQAAGAQALNEADVVAALKITDEQKEKLEAAQQEAQDQIRELFQDGDQDAAREKMADIREEADKAALAVLSDEQKKQLEDMKGEAIELTQDELRRARGGGRRGGRGQGDDA